MRTANVIVLTLSVLFSPVASAATDLPLTVAVPSGHGWQIAKSNENTIGFGSWVEGAYAMAGIFHVLEAYDSERFVSEVRASIFSGFGKVKTLKVGEVAALPFPCIKSTAVVEMDRPATDSSPSVPAFAQVRVRVCRTSESRGLGFNAVYWYMGDAPNQAKDARGEEFLDAVNFKQ